MDDGPQRRDVVAVTGYLGPGEQPAELRGHHVGVGHPVPLDEGEQRLGLETVHQHDRVAELDRDRREVQHRRVVERRAAQVHVVVEGGERENPEEPGGGPRHLVRVLAGQRAPYALGAARRARGVDHGAPAVRGSGRPPGPSAPSAASGTKPGTAPKHPVRDGVAGGLVARHRQHQHEEAELVVGQMAAVDLGADQLGDDRPPN